MLSAVLRGAESQITTASVSRATKRAATATRGAAGGAFTSPTSGTETAETAEKKTSAEPETETESWSERSLGEVGATLTRTAGATTGATTRVRHVGGAAGRGKPPNPIQSMRMNTPESGEAGAGLGEDGWAAREMRATKLANWKAALMRRGDEGEEEEGEEEEDCRRLTSPVATSTICCRRRSGGLRRSSTSAALI
jgi:hypothetical protein